MVRSVVTMVVFAIWLGAAGIGWTRDERALVATVMPPVTGLAEHDALEQLRLRDLDVTVVHVLAPQDGLVVGQDPVHGTRLAAGASVSITVGSSGMVKTIVPNARGLTQAQARARLSLAYVLAFDEQPGPANQVGRVVAQHPQAGTQLPLRGELRLTIVSAPRRTPAVVGQHEHVARRRLRRAGLRATVEPVTEPAVRAGLVLGQVPGSDEPPPADGIVRLQVATHDVVIDPSPDAIPCPDVMGLTLAQAHALVLSCGLHPHPLFRSDPAHEPGRVMAQTEPAGAGLSLGAHVHFTIAHALPRGPVTLPSLIGAPREEANELLQALGLRARAQEQPSPVPAGTILDMRPAPGAQLAPGAQVDLLVATKARWGWGRARLRVPNLRGRGLETARRSLYRLGLLPQVVPALAPNAAPDRVTDQQPAPGERVAAGGPVRLFVPKTVVVPTVEGQRRRRAVRVLTEAGLRPQVLGGHGGGKGYRVVRAVPASGERIAAGSTVRLEVAPAGGRAAESRPGPEPDPNARRAPQPRPDAEPQSRLVPKVVNLSLPDATRTLEAAGFHVSVRGVDVQFGHLRTRVTKQRPPAGTSLAPGSKVIITLGF